MITKVINFDDFLPNLEDVRIFFGPYDGIQRYDRFKYPITKKLIELQQAQKWFPKEISHHKDKVTISHISEGLRSIYQYNLGFQTLADSLANRFLENVLTEYVTSPEWENCLKWQGNFELLHSESYSHTIREVYGDATKFFNEVLSHPEVRRRLQIEQDIYQNMVEALEDHYMDIEDKKKALLKAIIAQYVLENIRFMVSFLYTFKINRLTENGIQGTANSIGLIANDELIHTVIFRNLINILRTESSEGFSHLFEDDAIKETEDMIYSIYDMVIISELGWFDFLSSFEDIPDMNREQIQDFLHHYANRSLKFIGLDECFDRLEEPTSLISFFEEERKLSDKNVLAQENDVTSYTIAALVDYDPENKKPIMEDVDKTIEEFLYNEI